MLCFALFLSIFLIWRSIAFMVIPSLYWIFIGRNTLASFTPFRDWICDLIDSILKTYSPARFSPIVSFFWSWVINDKMMWLCNRLTIFVRISSYIALRIQCLSNNVINLEDKKRNLLNELVLWNGQLYDLGREIDIRNQQLKRMGQWMSIDKILEQFWQWQVLLC